MKMQNAEINPEPCHQTNHKQYWVIFKASDEESNGNYKVWRHSRLSLVQCAFNISRPFCFIHRTYTHQTRQGQVWGVVSDLNVWPICHQVVVVLYVIASYIGLSYTINRESTIIQKRPLPLPFKLTKTIKFHQLVRENAWNINCN